ncbi:hypothetical protein Tco_1091942 [Tanacetum coccineum]|uniref:Uncharacterized protein n=1 Tax=Tanacetum coccineum TaxID=301880 RepID=A0ABQ5I9P9_9ASTR
MDNPNLTMEEYIRLEEEKARKRRKVFNWQSATYGKTRIDDDLHDLSSMEAEFLAIVINDDFAPQDTLQCKSQVSTPFNNEIDFRISFDESDDEDYIIIYDKNSFSYKMIYVNNLKTDSENDYEKVKPSIPSPEPTISYFDDLDLFKDFENDFQAIVYNDAQTSKSDLLTKPILNPQHINKFDLNDKTSLSEHDEEEQNIVYFNDLFPFNIIGPDDLKSEKNNDDNEIDIIQPFENNEITHGETGFLDMRVWNTPIRILSGLSGRMLIEHRDEAGAWMAMGPEWQPVATVGAPAVAEDALIIDEGDQIRGGSARDTLFNYKTMDQYTMKALWIYWIRGDDEVELTDEESSDDEDEIAEVFRIDTNIFDYETPICSAFNEFNYLLKVDPDLLTKDIMGFKTYDDYKNDWIYEWNKDVPWVDEKPWTDTGVWTEPKPVKHTCEPFNYKTGCSEWPTCSWKEDGYCNGGNLPGTYIIENQLHYQDYEWYEALDDCELKEEALRNKAIMDGVINNDESCCELKRKWNIYTNYDDAYEINHEDNGNKELCEIHEPPVCNIRKYMMIKYSFNDDEEYVAVKEDEYDDLIMTRRDACQAYQEIFWIMGEGWMVVCESLAKGEHSGAQMKDILKINCLKDNTAISIKEDTAYPCLHSPKTTKETRSILRIQRRPIRRIGNME